MVAQINPEQYAEIAKIERIRAGKAEREKNAQGRMRRYEQASRASVAASQDVTSAKSRLANLIAAEAKAQEHVSAYLAAEQRAGRQVKADDKTYQELKGRLDEAQARLMAGRSEQSQALTDDANAHKDIARLVDAGVKEALRSVGITDVDGLGDNASWQAPVDKLVVLAEQVALLELDAARREQRLADIKAELLDANDRRYKQVMAECIAALQGVNTSVQGVAVKAMADINRVK